MKLNDYQLYIIDEESYSLKELRQFIKIATNPQVIEFVKSKGGL